MSMNHICHSNPPRCTFRATTSILLHHKNREPVLPFFYLIGLQTHLKSHGCPGYAFLASSSQKSCRKQDTLLSPWNYSLLLACSVFDPHTNDRPARQVDQICFDWHFWLPLRKNEIPEGDYPSLTSK